MKRLFSIIGIILISISARATTYYVATSGTDTNTGVDWAHALRTISNGVAKAHVADDTVLVSNGTYMLTAEISITNSITITSLYGAAQTIVDANNNCRCFSVYTNAVVDGFTVTRGTNSANGGGVYLDHYGTVQNCTIISNFTSASAGGVYIQDGGVVRNCTISANTAISWVGGVYCNNDGVLTNCIISGNSCKAHAAGARLLNNSTMQNCTIISNIAVGVGGGIRLSPGSTVQNCTISHNSGQWSAGGINLDGGGIVQNCIISANSAYNGQGGGVICDNGGIVQNCIISGNTAAQSYKAYGGGVCIQVGGTVQNCLISGNSSKQVGGGVYISNGIVENCTIINNRTPEDGGGVYFNADATVTNSIIYFNTAAGNGSNYYGISNFAYSCTAPLPSGSGNITDNPEFVDAGSGNYRLMYTSPCIDKGTTNVSYTNDFDGRAHWDFNGDGTNEPDMGCYEFYLPTPVVSPLYFTNTVMRGASATNQFTVWITNTMDGTTMYYSVVSSTNWLTTSVSTGKVNFGSTNTVVLTNSSAGLTSGSYTGLVTIAPLTLDWGVVTNAQTTNVQVVLQVNPRPYLNVSPTNLTRTILEGQNASTQTFEVWNSSQNPYGDDEYYTLTYTNTINTNWLSAVTPASGTSQGEHDTINVTYNTTNLVASTNPYTTTIRVDGTNTLYGFPADNSPQTIQVSVLVHGSPTLALAPSCLTNMVSQGHKATAQEFRVWNGSAEPRVDLEYTMSVDAGAVAWITLTPTNGTCKDNTNTVSVTYSTESLSYGWHTGVVTVASAGSTQTVGVLMRVNAIPVVSWDMTGWTNEISQGETFSAGSFQIWNGSAQPTATLNYELSDNMTWVSLNSDGGTSTGGHDTVTITYNTAGLSAGVYTGAITAAGTDEATGDTAQGSPKSAGLKLTVKGRAALSTSVDGITNIVLENYTETNSFTLWNGSGTPRSPMAYTVTDDATWLSVSPSSGTETDGTNEISVVFTAGTLSTGTYTGTITVDATDMLSGARATNAPKTIAATMIITPRTPSNYELPFIQGIPYAGQTLEVDKGLWQNRERLSFAYQWQRADDSAGSGLTNIASATSTNLVVSQAEKGKHLRIKVLATDSNPWPLSATVYSEFKDVMKVRAVKGDFDGDGLTDLWFFDAIPGIWRMAYSGGGAGKLELGNFYMEAAPGDYDGNGILDFCMYEQAEGTWYVLLRPSYELRSAQFGWSETEPVEGDYNGDGTTDIAVYWPEGGIWYILKSSTWDMEWTQFGWSETKPVPGDYDGDGATDLGLYINGTWYIWTAKGDYWTDEFGSSKALPAPGDYDGDGITDLGVYIPSDNTWHMQISSTGEIREEEFGTSNGACIPVQGYYDHDRQCDPATVHIERDFLIWCVKRSTGGYRGQSYQVSTDRWRVSW